MKKFLGGFLAAGLALGMAGPVQAASFGLFEWALNVDGAVMDRWVGSSDPSAPMDTLPAGVVAGAFDETTGLGSASVVVGGAGAHYVGGFFDLEIDESLNTYYNETGAAVGAVAAGQSWEIDEPGWFDGDIFANISSGALDNGVGTSTGGNTTFPDDVSMAQAWDFTLAEGEQALVTFILGTDVPSGFYLSQTDPDSVTNDDPATVYFSSSLDIRPVAPVPEPGTMLLLGSGLIGLVGARRRRGQG